MFTLHRCNQQYQIRSCGDNDEISFKEWVLLYTYRLPNTNWNEEQCVVPVMLQPVRNIELTSWWHKDIDSVRKIWTTFIKKRSVHFLALYLGLSLSYGLTCLSAQGRTWPVYVWHFTLNRYSMSNRKNTTYFAHHYLCNRSNSNVVMFGYIDVN
jgi:hypothetical protein